MLTDFYIFCAVGRSVKFSTKSVNISQFTLTLVPHYLEKIRQLIHHRNQYVYSNDTARPTRTITITART